MNCYKNTVYNEGLGWQIELVDCVNDTMVTRTEWIPSLNGAERRINILARELGLTIITPRFEQVGFMIQAYEYWNRRLAFPMGIDHWMMNNEDRHDEVFELAVDLWDGQNYLSGAKLAIIEAVRRLM